MPIIDGEFKTGRHLYGRGWLGLIPLVGGIVGIGLMFLGIFKYRDKKLFFIGLAALLFTVAIYSSLYYYDTYTVSGREGWVEMSQRDLNTLVSQIEFYKLQNGSYPDSLEQLESKKAWVFISDPLRNGIFNYRKIGNKYTVYSSGVDKIPNTSDDIYPEIRIPDSYKIGLIIKW